jgi:hypothetical protein
MNEFIIINIIILNLLFIVSKNMNYYLSTFKIFFIKNFIILNNFIIIFFINITKNYNIYIYLTKLLLFFIFSIFF